MVNSEYYNAATSECANNSQDKEVAAVVLPEQWIRWQA